MSIHRSSRPTRIPSPREHLRSRRPEQFSDSETSAQYELSEGQLGYHLDTLTALRRESAFETFARKLCEREVCPNILPQTGPVGGGDSKTDGSTYPVTTALVESWPWYLGRDAANEFWAFAFSTKKKWRAKLREDAAKLRHLDPLPRKAFFVTNQFVRDKERAEAIDEIRKTWLLDLTILDRQWITTRVLERQHIDLVIDALGIPVPARPQQLVGPLDRARQAELERLENELSQPGVESRPTAALVEKYLYGARLCRGMGAPRTYTLGFHHRADTCAARLGWPDLVILSIYERAWTTFWWYEDIDSTSQAYDELERHVLAGADPWHHELLSITLWNLAGAARRGTATNTEELAARATRLRESLGRIEQAADRPDAAAYARNVCLVTKLVLSEQTEDIRATLSELKTALEDSAQYLFTPSTSLLDTIVELGSAVPPSDEYDALFELACELKKSREGQRASGVTLLKRGLQCLSSDNLSSAISYLARAREELTLNEALGAFSRAIAATGSAYEALGLRWAARLEFCRALYLETRRHTFRQEPSTIAANLARRLFWLELELGRVPIALAWRLLALHFDALTGESSRDSDLVLEDGVLAVSLLHTSREDLLHLGLLEPLLSRQALQVSRSALLFLLGHLEEATKTLPNELKDQPIEQFFLLAAAQPARHQMRLPPTLLLRETVEWTIDVKPVRYRLIVDNAPAALLTAEHLAGTIELLAHSANALKVIPMRSEYAIRIRSSVLADNPPRVYTNDDGRRDFDLDFAVTPRLLSDETIEAQQAEREWLADIALRAFASSTHLRDDTIQNLAKHGVLAQVFDYPPLGRCIASLIPIEEYLPGAKSVPEGALSYMREHPWSC